MVLQLHRLLESSKSYVNNLATSSIFFPGERFLPKGIRELVVIIFFGVAMFFQMETIQLTWNDDTITGVIFKLCEVQKWE